MLGICVSLGLVAPIAGVLGAGRPAVPVRSPIGASRPPSGWSAPSTLAACAAAVGPLVVFPSQGPNIPTGPGAILWRSGCGQPQVGSAHSPLGLSVALLDRSDRARLVSAVALPARSGGNLAAVGGGLGRIAIAVSHGAADPSAMGSAVVLQGRASRPTDWRTLLGGPTLPLSLTHAYLGQVAVAQLARGPVIAVRVESFFQAQFSRPRLVPIAAGPVTALTATMDYRGDVLLAWQQDGAIRAVMLRGPHRVDQIQRLGPAAPDPQLRAVVSDNGRGFVAWSSAAGRSGEQTRVYVASSRPGVRPAAPRLLASYIDPQALGRGSGALGLVRLSTENVLLAWTAVAHGRYVVRAGPVLMTASRGARRLTGGATGAVLADLAPGPVGEAITLLRSAPVSRSRLDLSRTQLWAQSVWLGHRDGVRLGVPELVAPAGPLVSPSIAVDPATDRPVAAWLRLGARSQIEYASRPGAPGYRPRPLSAGVQPPPAPSHWLRLAAGIAAAAAGFVLTALVIWRRRRQDTSPVER